MQGQAGLALVKHKGASIVTMQDTQITPKYEFNIQLLVFPSGNNGAGSEFNLM